MDGNEYGSDNNNKNKNMNNKTNTTTTILDCCDFMYTQDVGIQMVMYMKM